MINKMDLGQMEKRKSAEILAITSGESGADKSIFSANMVLYLQKLNKKVLFVDTSFQSKSIDLLNCGGPQCTIIDVIKNHRDLKEVIVNSKYGIDILSLSPTTVDLFALENEMIRRLNSMFVPFENKYDLIVVDTNSGISKEVTAFVLSADKVIVVVIPDSASITDGYSIIKSIKHLNSSIPVLLVTNMVNSVEEGKDIYVKVNLIAKRFLGSEIIFGGAILRDYLVEDSIRKDYLFVNERPNSVPASSLKSIVQKILSVNINTDLNRRRGFFERFMYNRNNISNRGKW